MRLLALSISLARLGLNNVAAVPSPARKGSRTQAAQIRGR